MKKNPLPSSKTFKQEYFDAYKDFKKEYRAYIKAEKEYQACKILEKKKMLLATRNKIGYEFCASNGVWEKLYLSWLMYGEELNEEKLLIEKLKLADCEYKVDLTRYSLVTKLSDKEYFEKNLKNDLEKKLSILSSLQYYNQKKNLNIITIALIVNVIAMCLNTYLTWKK